MSDRLPYSKLKNPNLLLAAIFADGLAQVGLTAVVISPGSRSTPLTLAFEAQPQIETFIHLDERGAGFFALGLALAGEKPVALVCTSGTAAANYLPAIVEARMSQVPLLVLTSDRPHELRQSGANQTIDQVKIFADQVLWSVDMPLPHADPPPVALRHIQTTAVRAFATANGLPQGPVHINFPFRKPLEPAVEEIRAWEYEMRQAEPFAKTLTPISRGEIFPSAAQLDWLTAVLSQHERGLIICGPRCPGGDFPQAVTSLAQHAGYPILADPISGVRFLGSVTPSDGKESRESAAEAFIISSYETFLQADPGWPEPEIVVRFGAVPTSKWLNVYLDKIEPAVRLHIRENGVWADDSQRTTHLLQLNETAVCQQLLPRLPWRNNQEWVTAIRQTDQACQAALESALDKRYFDGAIVKDIVDLTPRNTLLFMGNSSPIRHLDQYGHFPGKRLTAYANRGASGIDGNLATALGLHAASDQPLVAVVGDITFFHDMNSLLLVKNLTLRRKEAHGRKKNATLPAHLRLKNNITIVLLHNDGGGIFNRLPIAQFEPPFTARFLTPHGLDFEPVCRMFGLDYIRTDSREAFRAAFSASVQDDAPRVIAVHTQNQADEAIRREINMTVSARLKG